MQNIWFSAVFLLCVGGVGAVTISQAKKMVQFQCGEWKKKFVCLAHWVIDDLLMSAPSYPDLSSPSTSRVLGVPYTRVNKRIRLFPKLQGNMRLIPNMRLICEGKN